MEVCRKRSTNNVPTSLSISYLIGSPPTGTSMMTLTSSGGLLPMGIASMRMTNGPLFGCTDSVGGSPAQCGRLLDLIATESGSIPDEGDLAQRLLVEDFDTFGNVA